MEKILQKSSVNTIDPRLLVGNLSNDDAAVYDLGNGMAAVMQVPVLNDILNRQRFTETQTKKHRTERWENVADSFVVKNDHLIKGKKILLVDDVVTTGATLEASGNTLLKIEGVQLGIATLTFASK